MALPCASANTCISMWRGAATYFSISTRASPNDALRLALRAFERGLELGVLVDAPHALAAAAGHRLDQHRIADLVGLLLEKRRLLPLAVIARHDRHAGLLHQRLGAILQAHGADRRRRRADEHDAGLGAGLGELRHSRKEIRSPDGCIARPTCAPTSMMPVDDEIALGRGRRPDRMRLVALPHMQRVGVRLRNRPRWCAGRAALAVRAIRQAISPRLAIRTEANMAPFSSMILSESRFPLCGIRRRQYRDDCPRWGDRQRAGPDGAPPSGATGSG